MGERKQQQASRGFTIIEVLIVLAVTGLIFLSASQLINGRQNRTEFTQAVQDIQSQIQQTSDDVINGFYPNAGDFKCQNSSGSLLITNGSYQNSQGTNSDCLFIGKFVQFSTSALFTTYPIIGLRQSASGQELTSLGGAQASVLASKKVLGMGQLCGATCWLPLDSSPKQLEFGLSIVKIYYNNNPFNSASTNQTGAIGFLSSLGSISGGTNTLNPGSQQVNIYAANPNSSPTNSDPVSVINTYLATNPSPVNDIEICFSSGTTTQSGLITLGGNGRQLSTALKVYSNTSCT